MYYFYILRCSDNSLYSGITNNLEKRLKEHNSSGSRSAKYLRAKKPVKLVYYERKRNKSYALKRELEVKKWSKSQKETFILKSSILNT